MPRLLTIALSYVSALKKLYCGQTKRDYRRRVRQARVEAPFDLPTGLVSWLELLNLLHEKESLRKVSW
jgi:hypothetical protein